MLAVNEYKKVQVNEYKVLKGSSTVTRTMNSKLAVYSNTVTRKHMTV